jgi:L-serine deaminase
LFSGNRGNCRGGEDNKYCSEKDYHQFVLMAISRGDAKEYLKLQSDNAAMLKALKEINAVFDEPIEHLAVARKTNKIAREVIQKIESEK